MRSNLLFSPQLPVLSLPGCLLAYLRLTHRCKISADFCAVSSFLGLVSCFLDPYWLFPGRGAPLRSRPLSGSGPGAAAFTRGSDFLSCFSNEDCYLFLELPQSTLLASFLFPGSSQLALSSRLVAGSGGVGAAEAAQAFSKYA